jgi:hypothetical protein
MYHCSPIYIGMLSATYLQFNYWYIAAQQRCQANYQVAIMCYFKKSLAVGNIETLQAYITKRINNSCTLVSFRFDSSLYQCFNMHGKSSNNYNYNCWYYLLCQDSNLLQAAKSGVHTPMVARFSAPVQTSPGAHPASCTMGTGYPSQG